MNAKHYTYRVRYSTEDDQFVATVAEFPSLSWLADQPNDALTGAIALVADVVADMRETGEDIPVPISQREYSGKFMVRIPPEAHQQLALDAAEQHVSLNRLAARRLAGA